MAAFFGAWGGVCGVSVCGVPVSVRAPAPFPAACPLAR